MSSASQLLFGSAQGLLKVFEFALSPYDIELLINSTPITNTGSSDQTFSDYNGFSLGTFGGETAGDFSATDACIVADSLETFDLSGSLNTNAVPCIDFTASIDVYYDSAFTGRAVLFHKGNPNWGTTGAGNQKQGFKISLEEDGHIRVYAGSGALNTFYVADSADPVPASGWANIKVEVLGTIPKLYIDDVETSLVLLPSSDKADLSEVHIYSDALPLQFSVAPSVDTGGNLVDRAGITYVNLPLKNFRFTKL